jgi:hypothetical protein
MKQHHFVIAYDTETKTWYWDTDQEEARFVDGTIYDKLAESWTSGYLGDGEYEPQEADLATILQTNLRAMNGEQ